MENDKRQMEENKKKKTLSLSFFLSSPDLDVENDKRLANAEEK